MDDLVSVAVLGRRDDLLEEPPRLGLFHAALLHDILEELATRVLDNHDYI